MSKILTCVCCGSDVTMPQFHNGMVYGYTCIKKVAPAQKQVKFKFFAVDVVDVRPSMLKLRGQEAFEVKFVYNGKKHFQRVHACQMCEQNGVTFIREDVFKK